MIRPPHVYLCLKNNKRTRRVRSLGEGSTRYTGTLTAEGFYTYEPKFSETDYVRAERIADTHYLLMLSHPSGSCGAQSTKVKEERVQSQHSYEHYQLLIMVSKNESDPCNA